MKTIGMHDGANPIIDPVVLCLIMGGTINEFLWVFACLKLNLHTILALL